MAPAGIDTSGLGGVNGIGEYCDRSPVIGKVMLGTVIAPASGFRHTPPQAHLPSITHTQHLGH